VTYAASASHAILRLRAQLLAEIRAFFAARNVLEVETPALSSAGVSDLALDSVLATVRRLGAAPYYLQTSPEYAMKRLLASGSGDIYQICRVFRDDELGRWHQPEFTLLEWYRQGWDERPLMDEVDELLTQLLQARPERIRKPTLRMTYADAFREYLHADAGGDPAAIARRLTELRIDVPAGLARDGLLDLAVSTAIAPRFAADALTLIYDYPASQAALARIKAQTPPVAARFEVFAGELELANGFAELTDAAEQRRRFAAELDERRRAGRHQPPLDEDFLAALERGLPACAGVAVGVDRLVAVAAGVDTLADAVSFAHRPPHG
jgi:lysyl-tRNA synthetase class 2